jgi:benzodiazapine receptor
MAGIIGSVFTFDAIPSWYSTLQRPDFAPPNWVFGPVWTTLYTLMGISSYIVFRKGLKKPQVRLALGVFGLQLGLNALWSILFFGLRSPILGLFCIIALLIAITATIVQFWKLSRSASILLVPYLLWVSFATILNYFIWALN